MKQQKPRSIRRQISAIALSVAVLWVVFAAAGSENLVSAMDDLAQQNQIATALLRSQLGDIRQDNRLAGPVAMVINQSSLLISNQAAALALQSKADDSGTTPPTENCEPIKEDPVTPDPTELTFTDNGVAARTLIPTSEEGYVVSNLAYISNSSRNPLSTEDLTGIFSAQLSDGAPQILIIHTHGSEAYTMPPGEEYIPSGESRTTDPQYNVVRVGDEIASALAEYGISTIHDRTLYDYPNYTGAYDRSLASIERYLAEYPSITFVLDIHRDAIYDGDGTPYKVISSTTEGSSAQLSLVIGTNGSGLTHDNWQDNLSLAVAVQNTLLEEYPTLMRPIVVRNSRYNQHCTTGSLLVEVGTAGNSLDEALLAARLFAEGLAETIL